MHTLSAATGIAIGRLVSKDNADIARQAAKYVELARVRLALENASIILAMVFAQPLILRWGEHWKFAYTVGLSLGIKFTIDGFFLADIVDHLTDEFSLQNLKEGEQLALNVLDIMKLQQSFGTFRSALAGIALELGGFSNELRLPRAVCAVEYGCPVAPIHVVLIDESVLVRKVHKWMVLSARPNAIVADFSRQAIGSCPRCTLPCALCA